MNEPKKEMVFAMNKSSSWVIASCVLLLCASLVGCTTDTFNSYSDYDLVVTVWDTEYFTADKEWSSPVTYYMPEHVFDLSDLVDDPIDTDDQYNDRILDAVAANMAAFGYLRVADPDEADMEVVAGKVVQENWVYSSGWWYGSWYWNYPSSNVSVSFPTGSVIISMFDPELSDVEEQTADVVWSAGLDALVESITATKVENGINQAFKQSASYLDRGDPQGPGETPDAGIDPRME